MKSLWHNISMLWKVFAEASFRKDLFFSLFSWIGLTLAYPPFPLGNAIWVLLIPWLLVIHRNTWKRAFYITFLCAFVHNAGMYYWIYYVMNAGPGPIVLIGLACLLSYLSLVMCLNVWGYKALQKRNALVLFPLVWIAIEVMRTKGQISFPWAHIGYTIGGSDFQIQASSFLGVFGIGALILWSNQCGMRFFLEKRKRNLLVPFLLPIAFIAVGVIVFALEKPSTEVADVVLVQPALKQDVKWKRNHFLKNLKQTWAALDSVDSEGADLIVFPETALPAFMKDIPKQRKKLAELARSNGSYVIIGSLDFMVINKDWGKYKYLNTAWIFPPDSGQVEKYNKIRLVPFSERLPFDDILPVLNYVNLGEGDFTAGTVQSLHGKNKDWSPNICYETIYPFFVRSQIRAGSRMIVNITNDGWFKNSTEPRQHLNLVRFRAAENGIPIVRSTNTGISAFVDQYGRVSQATEIYQVTAIREKVQLKSRTTLYSQIGDFVEATVFYFGLVLFGVFLFDRKQRLHL